MPLPPTVDAKLRFETQLRLTMDTVSRVCHCRYRVATRRGRGISVHKAGRFQFGRVDKTS